MPKVSVEYKATIRKRLIDAAYDCLNERGLDALTTREVLERAGLSSGTLYHYFTGKDELVMALAERFGSADVDKVSLDPDLLALVGRLLAPRSTPKSVLPELRTKARSDDQIRRALAHYDELVVGRFVPLVEQAQKDGRFSADADAGALVELVMLVFEALQSHAAAGTFVTSHERVATAFLSVLATFEDQATHA